MKFLPSLTPTAQVHSCGGKDRLQVFAGWAGNFYVIGLLGCGHLSFPWWVAYKYCVIFYYLLKAIQWLMELIQITVCSVPHLIWKPCYWCLSFQTFIDGATNTINPCEHSISICNSFPHSWWSLRVWFLTLPLNHLLTAYTASSIHKRSESIF